MKIDLACGGTGGHIFPGLATAEVLLDRGHSVTVWLAGKDIESEALKNWNGEVVTVPSRGLPSGISLRAAGTAFRLFKAARQCSGIMKKKRPDVLLAMGSYASAGPVTSALRLKVPVVLHESNVLPGKAIRLFSRWAAAVAGSFEETRYYLKRKDLVVTGMPLRRQLLDEPPDADSFAPGLDRNRFTVLVMGGSRGALRINEAASTALCEVARRGYAVQVIHLTGADQAEEMAALYEQCEIPHFVTAFTHDMGAVYATADLAICRAGASTCAEITAFGVPSLLVPYPHATNNHQMLNARALEKKKAADVVPEGDLGEDWLEEYIMGCIEHPGRLARMSAACKNVTPGNAAVNLADLVEETGRKNPE